jgi:NmrA-like family
MYQVALLIETCRTLGSRQSPTSEGTLTKGCQKSTRGADAEPATTIGRLHRQEEKVIEESGIPYTFLRPTSFMQNFVNI